jgi:salicylate hydroxylase
VHVTNARNVPLVAARPAAPPVVLIGDADHAITPAAGSGGVDAIKDAAALTHAITEGRSVADVIAQRRSIIQAQQAQFMRMVRAQGG